MPFHARTGKLRESDFAANCLRRVLRLRRARVARGPGVVVRTKNQHCRGIFFSQRLAHGLQVRAIAGNGDGQARRLMERGRRGVSFGDEDLAARIDLADHVKTAAFAAARQVAFLSGCGNRLQGMEGAVFIAKRDDQAAIALLP